MLTRLHISSFIGLTILVWLVALWAQGLPVVSAEFVKPFSMVVGIITAVVTLFTKYAWTWAIFRGWYVKQPDLRGTWLVELKSSWVDPVTNEPKQPIQGYAVIHQTLTSLHLRLLTEESRSTLVTYSIESYENDTAFKLIGVYRNEPKIELQGSSSEIHHGSFLLEVHGTPAYEMDGHYWTDRGTKGSMKLINRIEEFCDTYEQAKSKIAP